MKKIALLVFVSILVSCAEKQKTNPKNHLTEKTSSTIVQKKEEKKVRYRKLFPFQHKGKWGIVDSLSNEILKPTYRFANIFDDFMYAEFDGKVIYNLQTGEKQKAIGEYIASVTIDGKKHHVFSNKKNSFLVDLQTNTKIKLQHRYTHIENVQLYDKEHKKANIIVKGYLDKTTVVILKTNKELTPLFPEEISVVNFDFIDNTEDKAIGFVIRKDGFYNFYNHNFNHLQKIKAPDTIGYYELLTPEVEQQLPKIYSTKHISSRCSNCESIWHEDYYWDDELQKIEFPESSDYYITKVNRTDFMIKHKTNEQFSLEISATKYNFERRYKKIEIIGYYPKPSFFLDLNYIGTPRILFPKKYLANFKAALPK